MISDRMFIATTHLIPAGVQGVRSYRIMQAKLFITALSLLSVGTAVITYDVQPARAEYGFREFEEGWLCEGQWQGTETQPSGKTGRALCTQRDTVDPGNPYQFYRGDVVNGTFTGYGTLVYENNDRYIGRMENGRPNGSGQFIDVTNNRRYQGIFRNGEMHGEGSYTFGNGSRYKGRFAGSQPHDSDGELRVNGDNGRLLYTYKGRFYLGVVNGNGTLTLADGTRCRGVFYSNDLVGHGICTFPSGSPSKTYTGELKNGLPDGRGTLERRDGTTYSGEFRLGVPGVTTSRS